MLHITRPQIITMYSLMMTLPTDTEFDHIDTDNMGAHLIKASNAFGEGWYKIHRRGGRDDVTAKYADRKPPAAASLPLDASPDEI